MPLFLAPYLWPPAASPSSMSVLQTHYHDNMEAAFRTWIERLEELSSTLAHAPLNRPDILRSTISALLDAHRDYYDAKSHLADLDVVRLISPTWLTPFERTFIWIAGWKPSLAFRLVFLLPSSPCDPYVDGAAECCLSQEQRAALERLRRATAVAERRLSEDMARAQESMAGQQALAAIRGLTGRNGDARVEAAEAVLRALRDVVVEADELRERTATAVMAVLRPAQAAKFLASAAELRLRIRRWGLRRESL